MAAADNLIHLIENAKKSSFLPFSSHAVHPQSYKSEHYECVRVDKGIAPTYNTFTKVQGWDLIFSHNIGNTTLAPWRRALFKELHQEVFKEGITKTTMTRLFQEVQTSLSSKIKEFEAMEPEVEDSDYEDEDSMKKLEPEHWLPHLLSTVLAIKDNRHLIVGGPGPVLVALSGVNGCQLISVPDSSSSGGIKVVEGLISNNEHLVLLPVAFKDVVGAERISATVKGNVTLLETAQALLQLHSTDEGSCVVVLKPSAAAPGA